MTNQKKIESGIETWYCSNCKAVVLFLVVIRQFSVKSVTCGFTMTALSSQNHNMKLCKTPAIPGFAQNFSDSFFDEQLNLDGENRFNLLAKGDETKSNRNSFISGLKFLRININSIRGNKNCVVSLS